MIIIWIMKIYLCRDNVITLWQRRGKAMSQIGRLVRERIEFRKWVQGSPLALMASKKVKEEETVLLH